MGLKGIFAKGDLCDAAIHQLFFWDLCSECDPEPASLLGGGLEDQAASLNIPLAGALVSYQDIQQLLHFRASE